MQGFSALIKGANGTYTVLSDNGFGSRANSSDYLLSIYHIEPDFRTATGGTGTIRVGAIIHLRDPAFFLPYPAASTMEQAGTAAGKATGPDSRLLTGADLDPESFRRVPDGSYWIGEEFIPSLLHFDADGVMLAPPYRLAGLSSIDNPFGDAANLPRSRGFEGMAISPDGEWLYPMLEGALAGEGRALNIYTFNINEKLFVNINAEKPSFRYRLNEGASAIGDFTMFSKTAGLVLERDSGQGDKALLKSVYRIDFEQLDEDGFLRKTLVADLLNIQDPDDLNQDGGKIRHGHATKNPSAPGGTQEESGQACAEVRSQGQ